MLSVQDLINVIVLVMVVAWIWHLLGIRQRAVVAARRHCQKLQLQFLDESVHLLRFRLRWVNGMLRLVRHYGFEFAVTGEQRYQGDVIMLGGRVQLIELEPYPMPEDEFDDLMHRLH
ncbi:DUF3301 domain-containing protein [Gynuella sp.]|uniref:DUF3301 domain-containing protein n=1 Tax=Gynuella sp. TaxID=2969146 RepID=UPI003D10235B